MEQPSFDPGLTQKVSGNLRRFINKDGTFNVRRQGVTWRATHPYLRLINMSWPAFLTIVFFFYVAVNALFAVAYFLVGMQWIHGGEASTAAERFTNAFFFSAQILSTVGYGAMTPHGVAADILTALEAMLALNGIAL